MDVYQLTLVVLVLGSGYVAFQHHKDTIWPREALDEDAELQMKSPEMEASAVRFKNAFLPVYLLVMAADWLQGPYIYTLYKDEKGLAESVVAALFMTGFVSAALSASLTGSLADKYGRRYGCLVFCVIYSASCLATLSNDLIILFPGRVLGGISSTLMYSVFESWMVTEYHNRKLMKSSLSLSSMFGLMTTLNSVVAIGAGLAGQLAVSFTRTKTSPFLAAVACLGLAAWIMLKYWNENYGDSAVGTTQKAEKSIWSILKQDKRIIALGLISCCFEGSMYLFVFFWSAAMKSAHNISSRWDLQPGTRSRDIPFGIIFAIFMSGMMLGSLGFSIATTATRKGWLSNVNMLTMAIAGASISLLVTVFVKSEKITLWCFCIFEMCVGIYYPSMGYQKGKVIDDGVRAKIYGVMRIPLNVFVVVALSLTTEGDTHRDRVFLFCGGLLLVASVAAAHYLDDSPDETKVHDIEARDD